MLVFTTQASSEGSGESAHLRSLARTFPARIHVREVSDLYDGADQQNNVLSNGIGARVCYNLKE